MGYMKLDCREMILARNHITFSGTTRKVEILAQKYYFGNWRLFLIRCINSIQLMSTNLLII